MCYVSKLFAARRQLKLTSIPSSLTKLKGEVKEEEKIIRSKFLSDPNLEKFQKAMLTEKPQSWSTIKLNGPKLTK